TLAVDPARALRAPELRLRVVTELPHAGVLAAELPVRADVVARHLALAARVGDAHDGVLAREGARARRSRRRRRIRAPTAGDREEYCGGSECDAGLHEILLVARS